MLTFEFFDDDEGQTRWRAIHANGNNLFGPQQGYSNPGDARSILANALEQIRNGEYVIIGKDGEQTEF